MVTFRAFPFAFLPSLPVTLPLVMYWLSQTFALLHTEMEPGDLEPPACCSLLLQCSSPSLQGWSSCLQFVLRGHPLSAALPPTQMSKHSPPPAPHCPFPSIIYLCITCVRWACLDVFSFLGDAARI